MKKNIIKFISLVFLFTLLYSIVRYNVFKGVPWTDLPLYVMNKAISFAAIIYIASYLILEKKGRHELSSKIRKYATNVLFIHLIVSLFLYLKYKLSRVPSFSEQPNTSPAFR